MDELYNLSAQTRTDALNWDLVNDGIGNPKNVKSMLLAHETPKAMSLAVRADAETAVRKGFTHIQFVVRPESDAVKVDKYLKALKPESSPYLVPDKKGNLVLSETAKRGKKLFEEMSCVSCHPAPCSRIFKLMKLAQQKDKMLVPVDTPTLIEVWRTGPYLHDGRAATMREVLIKYDHAGILKRQKI